MLHVLSYYLPAGRFIFFVGMGLQKMFSNQQTRKEYAKSELEWKQELAEGEDDAIVRDLRNQELVKNMKYVSLERQIYFDHSDEPEKPGLQMTVRIILAVH